MPNGIANIVGLYFFEPRAVAESARPNSRQVDLGSVFLDNVTQTIANVRHHLGHIHRFYRHFRSAHFGKEQQVIDDGVHFVGSEPDLLHTLLKL